MRFENQEDLDREEKAIKLFTSTYNFNYKRFLQDQSDLPLAERKYNKIMKAKKAKIIIWAFKDGITYCQLNKLKGTKTIGGRKPREGSFNDIESMYYYNRKDNNEVLIELKY
mgnify:CR=1 FL=1